MAVRNIVLYPDDPLTLNAEPYTEFGSPAQKLARDMVETMHSSDGVGLAAPQIGISQRVFVCGEPDQPEIALFNPEIVASDGREMGEEGCLSIPEVYTEVPRATYVQVKYFDAEGNPQEMEARDFLARIIQHEYDHLNGVIFLDRADILTRQSKLVEWEEIRQRLTMANTASE